MERNERMYMYEEIGELGKGSISIAKIIETSIRVGFSARKNMGNESFSQPGAKC